MVRRLLVLIVLALGALGWGAARAKSPVALIPSASVRTASAPTGQPTIYSGATTQRDRIELLIARDGRLVTALRFSISYSCTDHRPLTLRALILRQDEAWAITDRTPNSVNAILGFSDWFAGPIGHDFHITGTLSADGRTLGGTLHSVLTPSGRHARCDSGPLRFNTSEVATRFAVPPVTMITRAQYRGLPDGITPAATERLLGAPNDRNIFDPNVVADTLPGGVPGAAVTWLDYGWRGHRGRYFEFFFRHGHLIPGSVGRSIASAPL